MIRADIISKVKVKLDEYTPFDESLVVYSGSELLKPIDAYIDSILDDCALEVMRVAPIHLLPSKKISDSPSFDSEGIATLDLDSDFLRIGIIQFQSWLRPVLVAHEEGSPMAILQKNKYTRGGPSKPVVVVTVESSSEYTPENPWDAGTQYTSGNIVSTGAQFWLCIATNTNKEPGIAADYLTYWKVYPSIITSIVKKLKCYTTTGTNTTNFLTYVPNVPITKNSVSEELNDNLIDCLSWLAAARVLEFTGNLKGAETFLVEHKNSFSIL